MGLKEDVKQKNSRRRRRYLTVNEFFHVREARKKDAIFSDEEKQPLLVVVSLESKK